MVYDHLGILPLLTKSRGFWCPSGRHVPCGWLGMLFFIGLRQQNCLVSIKLGICLDISSFCHRGDFKISKGNLFPIEMYTSKQCTSKKCTSKQMGEKTKKADFQSSQSFFKHLLPSDCFSRDESAVVGLLGVVSSITSITSIHYS